MYIVCSWSNCGSARSKVSAAILNLVFAIDIIPYDTPDGNPLIHFPSISLKPLHFGVVVSLSAFCFRKTKKSSKRQFFGRARGSTSMTEEHELAFLPLSFRHALFCLCSISGLKSELLSRLVFRNISLAQVLADKGPVNLHLYNQFHLVSRRNALIDFLRIL